MPLRGPRHGPGGAGSKVLADTDRSVLHVGSANCHSPCMNARPRLVPLLAVLALSAGLVAGCGGDDDDDDGAAPTTSAASGTTSPSETSAAPTTGGGDTDDDGDADAPPFPANTEPDTAAPSAGALLSVTDMRIGRHDGFDRVVFEFDGTGTPGWNVRYVDEATSQGSGNTVEVDGAAILGIVFTGVGYPVDTGVEEYSGPRSRAIPETEVVTEAVFDGTFEGQTTAFIGTTAEVPFRAYLLEDPVRVVIEVRDDG
jgi:hypothetical protein